MSPFIANLSPELFWDVDRETVDPREHREFVVQRVVERGTIADWRFLRKQYGLDGIVDSAKKLRSLDPASLSFLSSVGHVPKEDFRCFTAKHWLPPL